jgi:hypothetical protein
VGRVRVARAARADQHGPAGEPSDTRADPPSDDSDTA